MTWIASPCLIIFIVPILAHNCALLAIVIPIVSFRAFHTIIPILIHSPNAFNAFRFIIHCAACLAVIVALRTLIWRLLVNSAFRTIRCAKISLVAIQRGWQVYIRLIAYFGAGGIYCQVTIIAFHAFHWGSIRNASQTASHIDIACFAIRFSSVQCRIITTIRNTCLRISAPIPVQRISVALRTGIHVRTTQAIGNYFVTVLALILIIYKLSRCRITALNAFLWCS